jgi:hypothetical protein
MKHDFCKWRGFFLQIRKDSGDFIYRDFLAYMNKNKPFFFLYRVMDSYRKESIMVAVTAIFYIASYIFIRFPCRKKYLTMLKLGNEKWPCDKIFAHNRGKIGLIRCSMHVSFLSIKLFFQRISRRDLHVIRKILSRYDLFIALRGLQYIAYYDRFNFELLKGVTETIIVFSDGNPHGRALLQLAFKKKIRSCFISHGEPVKDTSPVRCDIVVLLGHRSLARYENNASRFGRVIYYGHKEIFRRIREVDFSKRLTIGVFLSKSMNLEEVSKLNLFLTERFTGCTILVRRHPNMGIIFRDKRALLVNRSVRISDGKSIDKDIKECDFVISGDSTVHMEVLLRGCPSLYCRSLEKNVSYVYDYVAEGVVLEWDMQMTPKKINDFYCVLNKREWVNPFLNTEKSLGDSIKEINNAVFAPVS